MPTGTRSATAPVTDEPDTNATAGRRLRGLVVGLTGGAVATVVMSAFRMPISRSPPPPAWFWAEYVGDGEPEEYVVQGLLLHVLYGTVGGGVFGVLLGPYLSGTEADRERRATVLGAAYGVILSVFGVSVVLERVLGMELDPDERFVFHVSHLVYGLALGTWFGSRD